jgi:hypothetical protein
MGVDLEGYRAKFRTNRSEVQLGNKTKTGMRLIVVWFFGITIAIMLVNGGAETNPRQ